MIAVPADSSALSDGHRHRPLLLPWRDDEGVPLQARREKGILTVVAPSGNGGLQDEFEESPLPLAAVDLHQMLIVAATPSAVSLGGLSTEEVVGRPVLEVIAPSDRERAKLALEALASGAVDFVRGHGRLLGRPSEIYTNWMATVEYAGDRLALVQLAAGTARSTSPLERFLGTEPIDLTVGTVDRAWVITTVSDGAERLLGLPADEVVGRVLLGSVEQRHVDRMVRAAHRANIDLSVGLSVRMRAAKGGWREVRVVLALLAGTTNRLFILAPEVEGRDLRVLKLEEHLRRIAAEVQASGILEVAPVTPALSSLAGRAKLTPRQWEVLTRLLRGERVAMIARELFVSQSTVRNHLSAIYTRLGVHSQAELMALAVGEGLPPS